MRAARKLVSSLVVCGCNTKHRGPKLRHTRTDVVHSTRRNCLSPHDVDLRRRIRIRVNSLPDSKQPVHIAISVHASAPIWTSHQYQKTSLRMVQPEYWIKSREGDNCHMPTTTNQEVNTVVHIFDGIVGITATISSIRVRERSIVSLVSYE